MTCSLYFGTQVYHPNCTKGYSYYYQACCNVTWYKAWNALLWIAVLLIIAMIYCAVRRLR